MKTLIDVLRADVRQTLRDVRRSPGITVSIVATMALGVGVNAAMFTVLDRIMFRQPAGVVHPAEVYRLYKVSRGWRGAIEPSNAFSAPDVDGLRDATRGVASVAGFFTTTVRLIGLDVDTVSLQATRVTYDYFSLLGITPQLGRFFDADEMRYGDPRYVTVLSDAVWRRRFRADPSIIGRTVRVDAYRDTTSYTIIGIAPARFEGVNIDPDDMWVPYTARGGAGEGPNAWWTKRGSWIVSLLIRIPGSTDARTVEARLTTALRRVNADAGEWFDRNSRVIASSLVEARGPYFTGGSVRELTLATRLASMSLVVLVLAIANTASLMLMRSLSRQRDIAVRIALGASGARLVVRLLVEGALVTIIAASSATLLTYCTGGVLRSLLFSRVRWPDHLIDHRIVFLVIAMTALGTLVGSVAPLLLVTRRGAMAALNTGVLVSSNPGSRLRTTFLGTQTAICVALLSAAGLFVQSLHRAMSTDLGYDPDKLLMAEASGYGNAPPTVAFSEVATWLATSPGVQMVSQSTIGGGGIVAPLKLPGRDTIPFDQAPRFSFVDATWSRAMGLRIYAGRSFSEEDVATRAPVAMINRTMAERYWPGQSAMGQCIGVMQEPCQRVVGVFSDIRYDLSAVSEPYYVLPVGMLRGKAQPALLVRYYRNVTDRDVASVRMAAIAAIGSTHASLQFTRVAARMERQLRPWRIAAGLLSLFAIVGLASAAAGIFGLVSYDVGRRTREIGVRTALGATPLRVMHDVLVPSLRVIAAGIVIGIAVALVSGRLMESLLFETSASDPGVLATTALTLGVVAGIAGWIPAIRATRVNPVTALHTN